MILCGDLFDVLPTLDADSFDACVTDPPYEISFMGRKWDGEGVAFRRETWQEVSRVLKPGAHLVVFGGSRTHHRLMCAIEDAGFEIRDCLMWLYGSGFPKSKNVALSIDKGEGHPDRGHRVAHASRFHPDGTPEPNGELLPPYAAKSADAQPWAGWGTALKPAWEPIILARKPLRGTVAENVTRYGTGAMNIDASRIGTNGETWARDAGTVQPSESIGTFKTGVRSVVQHAIGRWPANVLLGHHPDCVQTGTREVSRELRDARARTTPSQFGAMGGSASLGTTTETIGTFACVADCPVALLDAQSGDVGASAPVGGDEPSIPTKDVYGGGYGRVPGAFHGDGGGASRFFYTAKASRSERDLGTEHLDPQPQDPSRKDGNPGGDNPRNRGLAPRGNHHPTVKPVDLMRWLVTLVTPPGGRVLDCFFGSGSTGVACERTGHPYLGIERDPAYVEVARRRCDAITPLFQDL